MFVHYVVISFYGLNNGFYCHVNVSGISVGNGLSVQR